MRQITLLLLIHQSLASYKFNNQCLDINRTVWNFWEHKLILDLQHCVTERYRAPIQNETNIVEVQLEIVIKNFKFNSDREEFSVYTWTFFTWHDERFKWDPKKYDGVETIGIMSLIIWMPAVQLINSIAEEQKHLYIPCKASSSGKMRCVAWMVMEAKCGTDLRDWPFDAQTCKLEFRPFTEAGAKIVLNVGSVGIIMIEAENGAEWGIKDYKQELNQTSESQLTMTFMLKRHSNILSAIVVYPSLIISLLTLSTLLIDARRNIRLLVVCFSLMCHFYFLSELAEDIPKHSKDSPRILLYYRGSFIMTSLLIVLSFVMKLICRKETECPNWIVNFNDIVYTKYFEFFILPRWKSKIGEETSTYKFVKDWTDFANAVNTVWIAVSVIVYISLYGVFMPHPNTS